MKTIKRFYYSTGAAITAGMLFGASDAHAAGDTNFSIIAKNISDSIGSLPGLVTGVSYLIAILLGVLGIMKIKDHVENPSQTPIKEGAIRLAAGGALFALPAVMEAMMNTIDADGSNAQNAVKAAKVNKIDFNANLN